MTYKVVFLDGPSKGESLVINRIEDSLEMIIWPEIKYPCDFAAPVKLDIERIIYFLVASINNSAYYSIEPTLSTKADEYRKMLMAWCPHHAQLTGTAVMIFPLGAEIPELIEESNTVKPLPLVTCFDCGLGSKKVSHYFTAKEGKYHLCHPHYYKREDRGLAKEVN